jgi:hypothetical protein
MFRQKGQMPGILRHNADGSSDLRAYSKDEIPDFIVTEQRYSNAA